MVIEGRYIDELIEYRYQLRLNKDYTEADRIRTLLDSYNVFIFDTRDYYEVYHYPMDMLVTRKDIEKIITDKVKSEKIFNAWLYSINNKINNGISNLEE